MTNGASPSANLYGDAMVRIEAQDNEIEAKKLDIALADIYRKAEYGDGTNPGYRHLQGQDAINGTQAVSKSVQKQVDELRKTASNRQVRDMFDMSSAQRTSIFNAGTSEHLFTQRQVMMDDTAMARVDTAINDFGLNYRDPAMLQTSMAVISAEVMDMADRKGWSEEVTENKLRGAYTDAVGAGIQTALAASDTRSAANLLKGYGDMMDSNKVAGYQTQINNLNIQMAKGLGQDAYNAIIETFTKKEDIPLELPHVMRLYGEGANGTARANQMREGGKLLKDNKASSIGLSPEKANPIIQNVFGPLFAGQSYTDAAGADKTVPGLPAEMVEDLRAATNSLYAKWAMDQGLTEFSEPLYQKAAKAAAGGVLQGSMNGTSYTIIAPTVGDPNTYDDQAEDFENMWASTTDYDLASNSVGGGVPVDNQKRPLAASRLMNESVPMTAGVGQYYIYVPGFGLALDSNTGEPFVYDRRKGGSAKGTR